MKVNNANIFRSSMLGIAAAGCMVAMPASADDIDVSASVAVSNLYLFRGQDLGNGRGMVSGDIVASTAGFYGGIWATSGDGSFGTEYDLFAGYATEFDGVSVDVSVINYMYPNADTNDTFGSYSEIFLNVGFMGFSFDYQDNVAADGNPQNNGFEYYAFGYTHDKFTVTLGMADFEEPSSDTALSNSDEGPLLPDGSALYGVDYSHLDLSYQYNDNLSFTISKIITQDEVEVGSTKYDSILEDDTLFVVNYSLPIDMK